MGSVPVRVVPARFVDQLFEITDRVCGSCGAAHDRDVNAATNILVEGRKVAAGQAETRNACGANVRPGLVLAVGCEAGTHRGVG